MPNWCRGRLEVTGPDEAVDRLVERVGDAERDMYTICERLLPTPPELHDVVANGKTHSWYEWQVENWGVKWGDCDTELVDRSPGLAVFHFTTPWGPMTPAMEKIARLYPELEFVYLWSEEDGQWFRGGLHLAEGEIRDGFWESFETVPHYVEAVEIIWNEEKELLDWDFRLEEWVRTDEFAALRTEAVL